MDWRASRFGQVDGFPDARGPLARAAAVALAFMALCVFATNRPRADGFDSLTIATASGDHAFAVEIAANEAARERGLMFRRFMPADRGMLFEFDREAPVSFWMKNTYIPLDIIFVARDGSVTRVAADAEPLSEATIPSGGPCVAVLELNGGTAAEIGLKAGDKVRHPFFKP